MFKLTLTRNLKSLKSAAVVALAALSFSASASAVSASTFEFENLSFTAQCTGRIDLILDSKGEPTNAADIIIKYDPNFIAINDSIAAQTGKQIEHGVVFPNYYGNIVNEGTGTIRLTGANPAGVFNGRGVFAVLNFTAMQAGATQITVEFSGSGNTLDSNIASANDNLDTLESVTNITVNIASVANCDIVTPPPPPVDEEPDSEGPSPDTDDDDCDGLVGVFRCREEPLDTLLDIIDAISLPGVVATIVLFSFLINLFSLLYFLRTPFLFYLFLAALFKRKKKPWGLILEKGSEKPIPFATIRLFRAEDNVLVETRVSDLKGRYGFVVTKGKYKMEVQHPYYHQENIPIQIIENEDSIDLDVYMTHKKHSVNHLSANAIKRIKGSHPYFWSRVSAFVFVIGFAFSIVACIISPHPWNYFVLALYVLQALFWYFVWRNTPKNWGGTFKTADGQPLINVHVKIYNPDNWALVDTQMTNINGRFGFFLEDARYAINAALAGYSISPKQQADVEVIEKQGNTLIKFDYNRNRKKALNIFMVPTPSATSAMDRIQMSHKTEAGEKFGTISPEAAVKAQELPTEQPGGNLSNPFA